MIDSEEEASPFTPVIDENGKLFHSIQPLRDLESNWSVDIAETLDEYLLKICSGELVGGRHFPVNFAEAAMLIQGSVQVYSRKVEYLYALVLHALKFITQSEKDLLASGSARADGNGSLAANDEENNSFWVSEDITVEAKNVLHNSTGRDSSFTQFVKAPASLAVLEGDSLDTNGDDGELESYLLATCHIFRGFILLDASDALTVDEFLYNDKNIAGNELNNSANRLKRLVSPTRRSGGTGNKSSAKKKQEANLNQSLWVHSFCRGNFKDDSFSFEMPNKVGDARECEVGCSEPRDIDDSDDEDLWKPLNPHEPGNLRVKPYRKVKSNSTQGVVSRKLSSWATEFPLARLHGPICTDLDDMWERRKRCCTKKKGDSQSLPYEKLRESLLRGENDSCDSSYIPKGKDEYDNADHDFGPPAFEMPENVDMNNGATLHGEKHDKCSSLFDNEAQEDPNAPANLEDLCRFHLDHKSLAEIEKQTKIAAWVSMWKQRLEQKLKEQESHPPFDIQKYSARILSKLSLEGNGENIMSFADIVTGHDKHDVARTFSALLQLVNNGDVSLERSEISGFTCYTGTNPFYVRLLRLDKGKEKTQLQSSKRRATSPGAFIPGCRFNQRLGKATPEAKRRRKSILAVPPGLNSEL